MVDCNNCKWINITEYEQEDKSIPHKCKVYNERLYHFTCSALHDEYIYPCDKCVKDEYKEAIMIKERLEVSDFNWNSI